MIKFFRGIRQKLIETQQSKKYFIYAIGEILLVVVGILIALQVNNWNERRKNRISEMQSLMIVKENLTQDLDDFEKNIIHLGNRVQACVILLNSSMNNIEYHDSLAYHLLYSYVFPHFTPNESGYELLKSKGIEIISNDSLKLAITNLYEYGYKYLYTWESEQTSNIMNNYQPMLRQYLGTSTIEQIHIPKSLDNSRNHLTRFSSSGLVLKIEDFVGLSKNIEIQAFIAEMKGTSLIIKQVHEETQNEAIGVIQNIERELGLKN